jgi:hypothetical protein
MANEGYRNAGDIELKQLTLITRSGQMFDITELMLEMSIFQNLYDKNLTCEIVMSDATGLIDAIKPVNNEVGGLAGSEVILLQYRTPSEENNIKKHLFVVNSIDNRKRIDEKIEAFIIEGVSLETFATVDKKISRSYGGDNGNTIEKMMTSLIKEFYQSEAIKKTYTDISQVNFAIKKKITVDTTKGLHKFVIPRMTVSSAIEFFRTEATSDKLGSYFVFYEDTHGFNFRNIANLVEQDIKATYQYEPSNYHEGGKKADAPFTDAFKIISFEILRDADMLDNMVSGLYGSRSILIDPLRKKSIERTYSYASVHNKFSKLQDFHIPGNSSKDAVIDLTTTRFQHDQLPMFNEEVVRPKSSERMKAFKRGYHHHLYNKTLEVAVHGNSELNVGDVVFLSIPVASTTEDGQREDKYMTGKHLITSLRHKFDKETFVTVFECCKDTGFKK